MAIRLDPERTDAQGFPVVAWEEDRNLFAPDGFGPARVACFIRPDPETGVLQFVAAGSVRHGPFEEARPWELLKSFEKASADQLYSTPSERAAIDLLAGKSKSGAGRLLASDGAMVMLANFADARASVPMHLNCADAQLTDVALLHERLHRDFIANRSNFINGLCGGAYTWPKDKAFISCEPPARIVIPRWKARAIDLSIAAVLALIGWGFYEYVVR